MSKLRHFQRILVTGAAGSGGSYLVDHILDNVPGVEVHGLVRWHSTTHGGNLEKAKEKVHLHECDLLDFSSVIRCIQEVKPDGIFHLASHANVRASFDTPLSVMNNNIMGTAHLFEAVRCAGLDPWILHCSTSEVYGQVDPKNVPIKEDCPIQPSSPYALSKVAQDLLGGVYYRSFKSKIIRTRMFAYINPRRADLFASSFSRQVARVELGLQDKIFHGNLDSVRTLIDVRDAVDAYWVALQKCEPGEIYNMGGTTVIKVGEFLDLLKKKAAVPIKTQLDPALLRPADVTLQIPDVSKFEKQTGWKAQYSFENSVDFLLAHWRREVKKEVPSGN